MRFLRFLRLAPGRHRGRRRARARHAVGLRRAKVRGGSFRRSAIVGNFGICKPRQRVKGNLGDRLPAPRPRARQNFPMNVPQVGNLANRGPRFHALANRHARVAKVRQKVPAAGIASQKHDFRPVASPPPPVRWREGIRHPDNRNRARFRRSHGRPRGRRKVNARVKPRPLGTARQIDLTAGNPRHACEGGDFHGDGHPEERRPHTVETDHAHRVPASATSLLQISRSNLTRTVWPTTAKVADNPGIPLIAAVKG